YERRREIFFIQYQQGYSKTQVGGKLYQSKSEDLYQSKKPITLPTIAPTLDGNDWDVN
ncbi:10996_t:CDS:2, partial [Racocetra fulgida]